MTHTLLLEVCAFNFQSCLAAERGGAGRIELCADPLQGGTTPSYGLLAHVREAISIPVYVMVRPRGGNFIYDADELDIMRRDIAVIKELGFPGIATGVQLADGRLDTEAIKRIAGWAGPMGVTCHKAFDGVPDAYAALDELVDCGVERVLTSGLAKTAVEGVTLLHDLLQYAGDKIIVMPGGGVRSTNIDELIHATRAKEYHSSAAMNRGGVAVSDESQVRAMVDKLRGE